jgi:hypothetical protein
VEIGEKESARRGRQRAEERRGRGRRRPLNRDNSDLSASD